MVVICSTREVLEGIDVIGNACSSSSTLRRVSGIGEPNLREGKETKEMARYGDVLSVLKDFRNDLEQRTQEEVEAQFSGGMVAMSAFAARGGVSAFSTPLSNVHATGVGIRVRNGKIVPDEFVLKVYVFDKADLGDRTPDLMKAYGGVEVDVETLPIQQALAKPAKARVKASTAAAEAAVPAQRQRHRPIVGGLSIAPLNEFFVGTLGCFLRRIAAGTEQIFALSNNHVLVDTNRLPIGTPIVQPGPEVEPTKPDDVFAALSAFIPIQFPASRLNPVANRFDAAIAVVADLRLIRRGRMFGINNYTPQLATALPGMRVIKSGRTTGVTTGTVTAVDVDRVQVNYGTRISPRIATFNDTIEIVGENGPFSAPGDSGSVILDRDTGRPVALLFAGDGRTTTACDLGGVCRRFQALPV